MIKKISVLVIVFLMLLSTLPINAFVITEEAKLPFADTRSGWFVPAVEFCYANSIMSGKSATVFDPKGNTNREQMMTVLSMLDGDGETYPQCSFTDVKQNVWYTPYVNKAVAKGYTKGISETLFGIGKTLTRQEAVTLMYNFTLSLDKECPADGDLSVFSDTEKVADWAQNSFGWAVGKGIIAGNNGNLNPRNSITRAELAQIIKTFCENVLYAECEHSLTEAGCTYSSECTLCGIKKGMPKGHRCPVLNCTEGSQCADCGEMISPKGHKYEPADCTTPMICSICGAENGTALGHTTQRGICARCGIEVFETDYDRFVYYISQRGMTDPANSYVKYLTATVKYTDGSTSTQYVKHNTSNNTTTFVIIYKFAGSNHHVKTIFEMNFKPDSVYHVESYYSLTDDLYHFPYYGSGRLFASDCSFKLDGYSGDKAAREQFGEIVQATLILSIDTSNKLIKQYTGVSMSDFGFTAFN